MANATTPGLKFDGLNATLGGSLTIPTGSYDEIVFTGTGGTKILAPVEMYLQAANDIYLMSHSSVNLTLGNNTATFAGEISQIYDPGNTGAFQYLKNPNAGNTAYVSKKWQNNDASFGEIWRNSTTRNAGAGNTASSFNMYNSAAINFWSGGTLALTLDASQDATFAGDVKVEGGHQKILVGAYSNYAAASDRLYIGGDGLASTDAAIYIGNRGNGTGYGYRIYYEGSGSGNNNKLILKSENVGTNVDMLSFTADGNATFGGDVEVTGTLTIDGDGASNAEITSSTASSIVSLNVGGFTGTPSLARDVRFFTNSASSSRTERARLNSDGALLVGKTSQGLSTDGIELSTTLLRVTRNNNHPVELNRRGNDGAIINFYKDTSNVGVIGTQNWGIGTSSPSSKLSIDASAQDTLAMNSSDGDGPYAVWRRQGSSIGFVGNANALSVSGNTNFGVRATNDLIFAAGGGSERMRLDSSGNFFVSKTSDSVATEGFQVMNDSYMANTVNNGTVAYFNRKTSDGSVIEIRKDNSAVGVIGTQNWGIGTTSPDAILHIQSASATGAILNLETTHTGGIPIYNMKGAHSAQLRYQDENGNNQSRIDFNDGGDFNFIKATDGTSHLKITSGGNVGIGTDSPSSTLDISAGTNLNAGFKQLSLDNFSNEGIGITFSRTSSDADLMALGVVDSDELGFFSRIGLIFATGGTVAYGQTEERMRITSGGLVGIGTTSPGAKLEIKAASAEEGIKIRNVNSQDTFHLGHLSSEEPYFQMKNNAGTTELVFRCDNGNNYINTGNLGIGTASPSTKLYVDNGESTFNRGNSAGTIATFRGLNSAQAVIGTATSYFLSDVGIGTTSPTRELEVQGAGNVYIKVSASTDNDSSAIELENTQETWTIRNDDTNNDAFEIDSSTTGNIVTIQKTGNVGIATSSPDRKLHVTGDDSDGIKISGGTNGRFIELSSSNLNYYTTSSGGYAMGQRILKNSDSSVLGAVSGAYGTGSALTYMYYGGTAYNDAAMYILPNKNIGIGTNAPARDLHLKKSNSGGQVRAEVFNTSNTANSHGIVSIYSGGASAGDPFLHWKVEGIQDWSMGIDNSDSDKLKISKNFGPGTNDYLSIDTSGNATFAGNITAGNSSTDVTIRAHHDDGAYVDHTGYGIQFARNASYLRPDADGTRTMYFGGSSHTWNAINFDSNSYSFQRNGSEYMQINSSGNISVAPGYNGGVFAADGSGNVDTNWGLKIQKTTNVDDYNVRLQFYPDGASATAARKLGFYDERNNAWLGYWDGSVNSNLNWIFNSGGNVGIGVTTPDTKLRIDSSDNNQLKLNRTGVGAFKLFVESGGGFVFEDDGTERMRLDSSGNVGIGTTSPSQKLEVIGTTRITGDLQLDQQNPRIDFDNGVASGSLRFFSTARSATIVNINPAGALSVTSDGSRADGSTLLLKHANNNTTDTIGTIFFGNNADETLSKIVAETSGANNTSNLLFGTSNAGTMATVLTLNADNSATFAGNVDATNFRDKDNTSYSLTPNSGSQGQWRVNTPSGYVDIGPANASYSHFSTDRGRFYFNKKLVVNEGIIGSYDEDLKLRRADADNDYILIRDTSIGFFLDTAEDMRLENDGDLHVEGDVIAYSTTISDNRLKDDVVTIDSALDKVSKLRGVEYTWNATSRKGQKDIGVIAQEVEEVIPEIVREKEMALIDGGKYKTVDYEKLTAVLIEAVKELKEEVEELKNKCNDCTC